MEKIFSLLKAEDGASTAEYALIVSFTAVTIILGMTYLGTNINDAFNNISSVIESAIG